MTRSLTWLALLALAAALTSLACDDGGDGDADADADADGDGDGDADADGDGDADADGDGDADADADGDGDADADGDGDADCAAEALGARLGRDHLMIGGSMSDESFEAVPGLDLRYHYVAGDVPEAGPCDDCAEGCFVGDVSCANAAGGCAWWGCWQWDELPPGRFVADFMTGAAAAGAVPMITQYIWFSVAGSVEGDAEVAALTDGARMAPYLADFRFLCQVMAEDPSIPAILHVEPDLWGYGEHVSADPEAIPAAVSAAAAPECAAEPDTMAGLARCMLAIARSEAPNVLVGFHASAWGEGHDALINTDPGFDLAGHAEETARWLRALGAAGGDLVVVEMSDRDAGYNGRWWDATDATLPSFAQAISWAAALGDALDLALLWWQVPYGHVGLPDECDRYQDNRVDYVFDHPEAFAAGGAVGVAFGAGAGCMTTPETDDGHFLERAAAYVAAPAALCGP